MALPRSIGTMSPSADPGVQAARKALEGLHNQVDALAAQINAAIDAGDMKEVRRLRDIRDELQCAVFDAGMEWRRLDKAATLQERMRAARERGEAMRQAEAAEEAAKKSQEQANSLREAVYTLGEEVSGLAVREQALERELAEAEQAEKKRMRDLAGLPVR